MPHKSTKIKGFNNFINENNYEDVVISYLNNKLSQDKNKYKGHIPTKYNPGDPWSDSSWITTEISNFLNKNYTTSYTLIKFGDKYDYDILDGILKKNFKQEYDKYIR